MRIARFETPDGRTLTGRLIDERTAEPLIGSLWDGELHFAPQPVLVRRLLAPLEPPNIFAIGRNYRAHIEETGAQVPETPLVFLKATTSVIGPEDTILLPAAAPDEVDFEAELALVIGRGAKRVPVETAMDFVFGYTCANDVSARDCQRNDKQWSRAKGFDTFCPIGPWIVVRDASRSDEPAGARIAGARIPSRTTSAGIPSRASSDTSPNPDHLAVRSRLNGRVMQDSNTHQMMRGCAELVSHLSHQFTLRPGTLILTGTPDGVGFARKPPVFLRPGDRIEVEVEGIGTLGNRVGREGG